MKKTLKCITNNDNKRTNICDDDVGKVILMVIIESTLLAFKGIHGLM